MSLHDGGGSNISNVFLGNLIMAFCEVIIREQNAFDVRL